MKSLHHNQAGFIHLLFLLVLAVIVAVGWWLIKNHKNIDSFETCEKAGNPVQEIWPEVCVTKDGKHFVQSLTK